MWSHYGGQYKGMCLEFRTELEPFNKLLKVRYTKTMPQIDIVDLMKNKSWEQFFTLIATKSDCWSYELEWRAIHQAANTMFTYFPEALKAIYFGPDIPAQDRDMICVIMAGQNSTVEFFSGVRSKTEFKVEFEKFTYTSLTEAKRLGMIK